VKTWQVALAVRPLEAVSWAAGYLQCSYVAKLRCSKNELNVWQNVITLYPRLLKKR